MTTHPDSPTLYGDATITLDSGRTIPRERLRHDTPGSHIHIVDDVSHLAGWTIDDAGTVREYRRDGSIIVSQSRDDSIEQRERAWWALIGQIGMPSTHTLHPPSLVQQRQWRILRDEDGVERPAIVDVVQPAERIAAENEVIRGHLREQLQREIDAHEDALLAGDRSAADAARDREDAIREMLHQVGDKQSMQPVAPYITEEDADRILSPVITDEEAARLRAEAIARIQFRPVWSGTWPPVDGGVRMLCGDVSVQPAGTVDVTVSTDGETFEPLAEPEPPITVYMPATERDETHILIDARRLGTFFRVDDVVHFLGIDDDAINSASAEMNDGGTIEEVTITIRPGVAPPGRDGSIAVDGGSRTVPVRVVSQGTARRRRVFEPAPAPSDDDDGLLDYGEHGW